MGSKVKEVGQENSGSHSLPSVVVIPLAGTNVAAPKASPPVPPDDDLLSPETSFVVVAEAPPLQETETQVPSQDGIERGPIWWEEDKYSDILEAAVAGNTEKVVEFQEKFQKEFPDETPHGFYHDKSPDSPSGPVTTLVILCQKLVEIYAYNIHHRDMTENVAELLKKVIDFHKKQKVDDKDDIHPLNRGGEKSALKCFEAITKLWDKEDEKDNSRFLAVKEYLKSACLEVAANAAAAVVAKEPSKDHASKWKRFWACLDKNPTPAAKIESVNAAVVVAKEPSKDHASKWKHFLACLHKNPTPAVKIESATKMGANTITASSSGSGASSKDSNSDVPVTTINQARIPVLR